MAAPRINTVTPDNGLASGRERVTLTGINFRLPPELAAADGPTDGNPRQTMSVTIGGQAADAVAVLDAGTLVVVTPEYHGHPSTLPAAVDITVANLDDNGDEIVGESWTRASAYTYKRPDVTEQSGLAWISRQLLRTMRRNIIDNVAISASPDWTDAPEQIIAYVADLPAVLLEGPVVTENRFYRYSDTYEGDYNGDGATVNAHAFTADLTWDIILLARRKVEALNLCDVALRYFARRPLFRFPRSEVDSTILEARVYLEQWRPVDRLSDQVFMYENTLKIEGIQLDDADGMPVDDVVTYEVDEDGLDLSTTEVTP